MCVRPERKLTRPCVGPWVGFLTVLDLSTMVRLLERRGAGETLRNIKPRLAAPRRPPTFAGRSFAAGYGLITLMVVPLLSPSGS
jgi:hypothetical protein